MATQLNISARPRTTRKAKAAFIAFRFVVYGVLGVFLEVMSYPVTRIGRQIPIIKWVFAFDIQVDPRLGLDGPWHSPIVTLFGQTSLWMIPIYALTALAIEIVYRKLVFKRPWLVRALCYVVVIEVLELASGHAVKAITGYAIWMYNDCGAILQMTTLFSVPIWIGIGTVVELIYRELMDPTLRDALELELSKLRMPPRMPLR